MKENSISGYIGKGLLVCLLTLFFVSHSYADGFDKDSLLKSSVSDKNSWNRIQALLELSDHYSSFYKDSSLMFARKAHDLALASNDVRGVANSLYAYAKVYVNTGNLTKAREYYEEGISLCKKNNEINGLIEGYMNIGFFYQVIGKNDSMMYYGLSALALTEKTDNIEIKAGVNHDIGNLYALEGNSDKALYYCKKSLATWNKIGHKDVAGILSDIGNIYYNKRDYGDAINYYRRAYRSAVENNDHAAYGYSLNNMGLVCSRLDSIRPAIKYFEESIRYYNLAMDKQGIANTENNLGDAFLKIKKYDLALGEAKKSYELYKIQAFQKGIKKALSTMAEAEAGLGNYKNAWADQKQASIYQDSLNKLSLNKQMADYQTKIHIERADGENNLLRAVDARQKAELKNKNELAIFICTIMVLCLIMAFLAIKSSQKRKKQLVLMAKLNEEIIEQKQILEDTDELKTKLFSIVSHDFKSPLASLQLFLSMFEEGDFTKEEIKELSGKLIERMNVTFSFIENLLGWAQSQMKGYEPNITKLNLYNLAEENFELYSKQAERKEIVFRDDIDPDTEIVTDRDMLKLVLRNLMSNAIKYTDRGGKINIGCVKDEKHITISVSDTGVGLSAEMAKKIFTSQRINTYGTFNEPGTGLGLMLCREFLEKIGGFIRVESEPGKGSTFSFDIPLASKD